MITDSKYFFIILVFLSFFVNAQEARVDSLIKPKLIKQTKWEGGFLLGAVAYTGDLEFAIAETRPMVGLFVRRPFGDYFAVNASIYQGILAGSDIHATGTAWRVARNIRFKSSMTELTARGEYHFLGLTKKISKLSSGASVFDDANTQAEPKTFRKKIRLVSPFIYIGGGLVLVNPKTNFNDSPSPNPITEAHRIVADKAANFSKTLFTAPFGGGLRIPFINKQAIVTLEGGFRPMFTDYLDGMSIAGNPNVNDWYFVGCVGLSKMLGYTKDTDKDGIPDKYDLCPFLKGDDKHQGCPDRDGDGITDDKDECPNTVGLVIYEGCPDTDGDGIIDKYDDCPTEIGSGRFRGCADAEKQAAAKKDTTLQALTATLDTANTHVVSEAVPIKSIEIPQKISNNDTLFSINKPILVQIPTQKDTENPITAIKPSVKDTSVSIIEKPIAIATPKLDTPQYVSQNPNDKPKIETKPIEKDKPVSTIEKPIAIATPKLDTPQYVSQKPNDKPKIETKPIENDKPVSTIEKPIAIAAPKLDTPQYISPKPSAKPKIETKPIVKDTLISTVEKPIAIATPKLDTPQYVSPKPSVKPKIETKPNEKDKTVSTVEKPIAIATPKLDTPQYVSPKPSDKSNDLVKSDTSVTNISMIEKPIEITTLTIDTPLYISGRPIDKSVEIIENESFKEKPIQEITTQKEVNKYLEIATVADTVDNAFNITRNHYTISPVYFQTSKSIYRAESFVILDEVAYIMLENPSYKLIIKGHTDGVGKIMSNQTLSVNRAKMCFLYLQRKGVPMKRMSFKGFGQTQPVADNDTEEARQLNRRVEFEIRD